MKICGGGQISMETDTGRREPREKLRERLLFKLTELSDMRSAITEKSKQDMRKLPYMKNTVYRHMRLNS